MLDRVREVTLAAYEHQDLPFEQLVSALKVRRSAAYAPVFQVVFALQNLPMLEGWDQPATRTGDELWVGEAIEGTAKFDLTLALLEVAGELVGTVEYRTELFEAELIQRLIRRYAEVLEGVIAKPERRLSELLQFSRTEQAELVERCQRSMPATLEKASGEDEEGAGPGTAVEAILARIWNEVLERPHIGTGENFFDIGGNSINAVRVMARVRDLLQVELPMHAMFEAPTIRTLAKLVEAGHGAWDATTGPKDELIGDEFGIDDNDRRVLSAAQLLELIEDTELEPLLRAVGARPDRYRNRAATMVLDWRRQLISLITRRPGGERTLPLSYAQASIWFMEQVYARTTTYSLPIVLEWGEGLDVEVLKRSLGELVRRHEILRTTFGVMNGVPVQRVGPAGVVVLEVVSEGEATEERLWREMGQPFDLERGPLLRAVLGRRSGGWTLLLNLHHIVADGWSVGIVKRELGALYAAYVQGRPSPLPELRVQYGDYAVWQRLWLEGERLQRLVEYWERQLAGAPDILALPVDRARPAVQSTRGASWGLRLSRRLLMGVKEVARREGVTEFMVLVAAFMVLLERHTGQKDVVIGVPMAMRERTELEPLIGYFVNMLVLRTEVGGDSEFSTDAGSGAGGNAGGIRASGFAVRATGKRAEGSAERGIRAGVSGGICSAEPADVGGLGSAGDANRRRVMGRGGD